MIKLNDKLTNPLQPESVFTGSAYTAAIPNVPKSIDGYEITGVEVRVTNADGVPFTAAARLRGDMWLATFAASCFASYGRISKGLLVTLIGTGDDGEVQRWKRGCGDFEVVPDTASAEPGDPSASYVVKGGDVYVKSFAEQGVQHYLKQTMVYDAEMAAWGAVWDGDYIIDSSGNFVEA